MTANVPAHINPATASLPATYESAKKALAECSKIDECHAWSNKAAALASYAKQADDDTLHKYAVRISARAIRRMGELLKQFEAPGARTDKPTEGDHPRSAAEAASNAGLSEHQHKQAVRVANVSEEDFEAAVEGEETTTITKLAERGKKSNPKQPASKTAQDEPVKKAPPGFVHATNAIGSIQEFANFCNEHKPEYIAGGVYPYETAKIRQNVATVNAWLDRFVINLKELTT